MASSSAPANPRPTWLRILIWIGVGFLLLNTVGVLAFFVLGAVASVLGGVMGSLIRLAVILAIPVLLFRRFGGMNVFRTFRNPSEASFSRSGDLEGDGFEFDVRPARASRLAPIVPLVFGGFGLLLVSGGTAGLGVMGVIMLYVGLGVAGVFVLPGARYRAPARIRVSRDGLEAGDLAVPLDRVAELEVGYEGIAVSSEPVMPGPHGVPTSALVGRALGRRQAARSHVVRLRIDGESHTTVLAGGLTVPCAEALVRELEKAMATLRRAEAR